MSTRPLPIAVLMLLALLVGLGAPARPVAARRSIGIMDDITRLMVEQLCPDGVRLLLAYRAIEGGDPVAPTGFNLVAVRQRDSQNGGMLLDRPVSLTPLDPPVIAGELNDPELRQVFRLGQRIEQRWSPGQARPGDRLVFFRSDASLARVETVGDCSLDDQPRLRNTYQVTSFEIDQARLFEIADQGTVTNVAVELWISDGEELGQATLTLRAPDGTTATLLRAQSGQSMGPLIGTGPDFPADVDNNPLVDGQPNPNFGRIDNRRGGPAVFDDAAGTATAEVPVPYTNLALASAGPLTLTDLRGKSLSGTWTLTISSPGGDLFIDYAALAIESLPSARSSARFRVWLPMVRSAALAGGELPGGSELAVYTNRLGAGWSLAGWSYGVDVVEVAQFPYAVSAPNAIAATFTQPFGGLTFRSAEPIAVAGRYGAIRFWVRGAPGGSPLQLYSQASDDGPPGPIYTFTAPANTWAEVSVPLSALGSPAVIRRFAIQDEGGVPGTTIYIDDVRLVP